ncbi:putative RNA-directed DNA polymerase, eukaryota, reverse transcriptase zinc-binding domain protein [Tanacetum coccineum]
MCELKTKINLLDEKAENVGLNSQERSARLSYMKNIDDLENIIRLDLMQKAKVKWAIESDENSKFFHGLVISKVLANRLQQVVHSVVSEVQTAFIKDRQIIDGPLMVNEIISWANKKRERLFILKVDFEKAFDSLDWKFLDHTMEQMGFSIKWRKWIHGCLNSAFASVLVNGSPTKEFKIQKGLCQGDPLSPFLFIIAVEALHVTLQEAKFKNVFEGVKVGCNGVDISHLQFADDALILGKWSLDNAKNLCRILRCFHMASGLKVNFTKSKFFGVGVSHSETVHYASFLSCEPSKFPCVYLGIPIGANMNKMLN